MTGIDTSTSPPNVTSATTCQHRATGYNSRLNCPSEVRHRDDIYVILFFYVQAVIKVSLGCKKKGTERERDVGFGSG